MEYWQLRKDGELWCTKVYRGQKCRLFGGIKYWQIRLIDPAAKFSQLEFQ